MNTPIGTPTQELRAFGEFFSGGAARSLTLLKAIEQTVSVVRGIGSTVRVFPPIIDELSSGLEGIQEPIDADVVERFEKIEDMLEELYQLMRAKHHSAESSLELRDSDGVCDAYKETMNTIVDVHEACERLRWQLMIHNASVDHGSPGPQLSSESAIREFLSSL